MKKAILAGLVLVTGAFFVAGCGSSDSTTEAAPKGPPPEVKAPDPGMLPPEQRGTGAKPSEGPDGGL